MTEREAAVGPASIKASPRLPGLDVTRTVALVGVVIMNYHGFLNRGDDGLDRSISERIFHPFTGPLSTRFAATFVIVAGMGVTLMTNRSRLGGDSDAIRADRWKLARRGLLLYAGGLLLEWIWPGTILFFYGALFMASALLFTLRTRWIVGVGAASAAAAAAIAWFRFEHVATGHNVSWLDPQVTSPRNLLLRTFVGHTHPLFPWLAFMCVGIVIGRALPLSAHSRQRLVGVGLLMLAGSYLLSDAASRLARHQQSASWQFLLRTNPYDRGLLYTIGTIGSSVVVFCVVSWLADRFASSPVTITLQHAGQMTLTLYVAHALVFNAVVHWWGWVSPSGLGGALIFSLAFWIGAITVGSLWHRTLGTGPLERVYRGFGG